MRCIHRAVTAVTILLVSACGADRTLTPDQSTGHVQLPHQTTGSLTSTTTIFGPETFERVAGGPVVESRTFAPVSSSPITFTITSASSRGLNAVLVVNGETHVVTSDTALPVNFTVAPLPQNSLSVRLTGKPGSSVTITANQLVRIAEPWTTASIGTGNRINRIWPLSATELYVTADWGVMFRSTDAGANWNSFSVPFGTPVYDVWGSSASNLYVTSWYGTVQHWDGSAWTSVGPGHYSANDAIYRIWGSGANDVYAVGDDAMIWHFDGSAWSAINPGPLHPRAFQGVWGTGANDVYIAGGSGGVAGLDPAVVYHYDGAHWQSMPLPPAASNYYLAGIWGSSSSDVFVAGFNASGTTGILLHFNGTVWSVALTTPFYLTQIGGTGPNDVYAVGGAGSVLHFDGTAWSPVAVPTGGDLSSIHIAADGSGWIGGLNGVFLHRNAY